MKIYNNENSLHKKDKKQNFVEEINLKKLVEKHSYFLKQEQQFYYELLDIRVSFKKTSGENTQEENINENKCLVQIIIPNSYLGLIVTHSGNLINFQFANCKFKPYKEILDRKELEALQNNEEILEVLYDEMRKIGSVNKTNTGFNLNIDICKASRYREENVYLYLKANSAEELKRLKKMGIEHDFAEEEMVFDIQEPYNFLSMFERNLEEGDLVVIPDLDMIKNDIKSLNEFILKFISKKVSFCIDGYEFLYYVYEECSQEEVVRVVLEFVEFYLEKKGLIEE